MLGTGVDHVAKGILGLTACVPLSVGGYARVNPVCDMNPTKIPSAPLAKLPVWS